MIIVFFRTILSAAVLAAYIFIGNYFEFWTQLKYIDNLTGAAPLVLLTGISGFLIALIWKRHKGAETSTMVLVILSIIWALLQIPAITGNWYLNLQAPTNGNSAPDLSIFTPFESSSNLARLARPASLALGKDLPVLDGATALYPVYSAFVNAVYDEDVYTPSISSCNNTRDAYERVIESECDIIFVAGASEKQKEAAHAAGADLVFTPIGREAFVLLVGKSNPLDNLSYQELKNIYSGKTAYWKTLGWSGGGKIIAFQRPEGSGSQTGIQKIMGSLPLVKAQPAPDDSILGSGSMMKQVSVTWQGTQPAIGYSYRYYATTMYPNMDAKLLSIEGIFPSNETIADGSYPFAADFYAVTNGKPKGNSKALIDWILTDEGQSLVEKTGYVQLSN